MRPNRAGGWGIYAEVEVGLGQWGKTGSRLPGVRARWDSFFRVNRSRSQRRSGVRRPFSPHATHVMGGMPVTERSPSENVSGQDDYGGLRWESSGRR